ncbi:E3 ubiquitin-protein ligase COP1 [Varanus komodoensis]|nr:E3 ubiquitin-protein ligase COP1 [Varanus komodoensis]
MALLDSALVNGQHFARKACGFERAKGGNPTHDRESVTVPGSPSDEKERNYQPENTGQIGNIKIRNKIILAVFAQPGEIHETAWMCRSVEREKFLTALHVSLGSLEPVPPLSGQVRFQAIIKGFQTVSPICFDMIEEAYMTKCGHSFCYKCIHQSLEDNNRCPKCNYVVDNIDHLYPNFLVNELILKQKQRFEEKRFKLDHSNGHRWQIFQDLLGTDQDNLDLANVNLMLELLVQKKKQLEAESHAAQLQILMEFLKVARRNKREQLEQIQKELSVLEEDIKRVEEMNGLYSPVSEDSTVPQFEPYSPSHSSVIDSTEYSQPPGFSGNSQTKKQPWYNSTLASRRKRLTAHFEDLEQCYFSTRMTRVSDDSRTSSQLDEFQECLSKFTRYNSVRPLATLSYASDLYNGSSIVSSIEFDRDCDYFAIAGVTKKIKVYEYGTVIQDAVDIHYPENEMTCNSKISCISWSSYHKNLLASSDYEGTVILWDGFTGQRSKVYQEHEKRCWSVDFNLMDPKLLASGSDDAKGVFEVWEGAV